MLFYSFDEFGSQLCHLLVEEVELEALLKAGTGSWLLVTAVVFGQLLGEVAFAVALFFWLCLVHTVQPFDFSLIQFEPHE